MRHFPVCCTPDNEPCEAVVDGFHANLADPRFSALFSDDKFALDPTDPRFKASQATTSIQKQRAAQRLKHRAPKTDAQAVASSSLAVQPLNKGASSLSLVSILI